MVTCLQPSWKLSTILMHSTLSSSSSFFPSLALATQPDRFTQGRDLRSYRETRPWSSGRRRGATVCVWLLPVDPWPPNIDSQSIASLLFALSLFPYLGFLYFLTKSKSAPKLTLFGFYFLLVFVGATIPAGIYEVRCGTSLSNVDLLHGSAESLLTLTNLFIVLGLRQALRIARDRNDASAPTQNKKSSL